MVQTAPVNLIGRTLGDFEVRDRLGTGGMGVVYKAHQRGMERPVALKVLPGPLASNPVMLQRFYQEARAAARLDHPNIVRAIAVGEQDGLHYFAMEYVEGESLARRISRSGPMDEPEAVRVITAVAEALEVAHRKGMVHRDVKPENVLLTSDGRVKLADLGLVKWRDHDLGLTQAGKGLGTINYMAPEQFKDAKHADVRCDIYGLGVTLYTALTGVVPWARLTPLEMYKQKRTEELPPVRRANPNVSPRTEMVIMRATRIDPAARPASCAEFLAELCPERRARRGTPEEDTQTRSEFEVPAAAKEAGAGERSPYWYVRYFDAAGQRKQLRLRAEEIRQGVKSGRLADNMRVARSENGPWLHLSAFNEFVDVVAQLVRDRQRTEMQSDIERTVAALEAGAPLRRRDRPWRLILLAGVLAIAGAALLAWFFMR